MRLRLTRDFPTSVLGTAAASTLLIFLVLSGVRAQAPRRPSFPPDIASPDDVHLQLRNSVASAT